MPISSSTIFDIADQTPVSAATTVIVGPPVGSGTGRGRLIHPDLGVYDYVNTPTETVGIDGDITASPIWSHAMTIGSGVDTVWPASLRDVRVIERWMLGETGGTIEHLRQLWTFFANVPADPMATPIVWEPNYATALRYNVVLASLKAGGEAYKLDRRLLSFGYVPSPIELELRVVSRAD